MPAKSPINHGMIRGTLKAGGYRRTGLSNSIMLSFGSFAAGLNMTERHGGNGVRYRRPSTRDSAFWHAFCKACLAVLE